MKKINVIITNILFFVLFVPNVYAAGPTAPKINSYNECITFAESFKSISTNGTQDYYYKSCYRVKCNNGTANFANLATNSGYRCNNGNGQPYVTITSDGCSSYRNTCNSTNYNFCATVTYIDCKKTSDGNNYNGGGSSPVTTTTTSPVKTTSKTTAKTTTTRKVLTTKSTTTSKTSGKTTTTTTTTTEPKKSSNTDLKRLVIDGTKVKYDNNKDSYNVKIPYDVLNLKIEAVPVDKKTTVTVTGNTDMVNEDTTVNIKIEAEDGTTKNVTLNIKRYVKQSDDSSLSSITIKDYQINFDKDTYNYTLKLPKEVYSLEIEANANDERVSKIEIKGNEKLSNNSVIEIIVTAEDGSTSTYSIKIKKQTNAWKYILLIVLLSSALIISVIILFRYLKKSKGKYQYE